MRDDEKRRKIVDSRLIHELAHFPHVHHCGGRPPSAIGFEKRVCVGALPKSSQPLLHTGLHLTASQHQMFWRSTSTRMWRTCG
jgi:hypothetical protein